MVTKNQIKFIKGLAQKKNRLIAKKIIVEGHKIINEFLNSDYNLVELYSTQKQNFQTSNTVLVNQNQLKKMSNFKNPSSSLAIFEIKKQSLKSEDFYVLLDNIQDPGNLGNIIRTCEWFGINQIICSKNSVDCYNPKVIQASMGSLSRVSVFYLELAEFIKQKKLPVYAADLYGDSIKNLSFHSKGVLIFGSESHGINPNLRSLVNKFIKIPKQNSKVMTESLNLSVAAGVVLSKFRI